MLILLFIAPHLGRAQQNDASTLLKIGDAAPAFNFDIDKNTTVNIQDYHGKIVLLNFFATWCGPCRQELPRVQKEIWDKFSNNPKFALFIFGREEGWDKVLTFKASNQYTFLMLPDEGRKVFSLFATQYIPRSVLLDENGKIIYQSTGYTPADFDVLVALIKRKLKETI
ncbi:thiol-disulfide isomerase/thioredoxin [Mucilaginibacter gracilis]|uniref:Thiol-disulfide isomerase/thioredoxin n=1 Tax=Mucilaginibacter gracilis TaxID=423350 RepID=A0A495J1L2_9SPHI|nr:thiol-disulfide isomerase/thioredoxin [Mucilaginibacter gracilis]